MLRGSVSRAIQPVARSHGRCAIPSRICYGGKRLLASTSTSDDRGGMTSAMYNWRVAAVHSALKARGKETGPLEIEDLTALGHLDQYHYLGVEANDHVIEILGLDETVHVLDIGSGIGGPARYISSRSGCRITGVELQEDICTAGHELTQRIPAVADKVEFINSDFVTLMKDGKIPAESFDHFMSLLVFLHIPNRPELLRSCYSALKPGATFIIEDFMAKPSTKFSEQELSSLLDVVSAPSTTTAEEYVADLTQAGFVDLEIVELSDIWQRWTKARHDLYVESKDETIATHGQSIYDSRVAFYKVVDNLFAGNLGGCRITGRKPSVLEAKLLAGREKPLGGGGLVNVVEGKQRMRAVN